MDVSKMPHADKQILCGQYFKAGFACLPFIWIVNVFWFYHSAFKHPPYYEQKQIQKYVIYSAIGASCWAVVVLAWLIVFHLYRTEWGEFADNISFMIPLGD